MNPHDTLRCDCEGWWEQEGFGRQPMRSLVLSFENRRLEGSGTDIVGPFALAGIVAADGGVALRKQYLGRHHVDYLGLYDGEGTLSGEWRLGDLRGRWLIALRRFNADAATDVVEISSTNNRTRR